MQSSPIPDEDDAGAGESSHTAANAASRQADATASMTPDGRPEQPAGAGESTRADDAAVPSPS